MHHRLAVAAVATLLGTTAAAAGRTLTAADLDVYAQLRDARALAEARAGGPGNAAMKAQAEADFQKAVQAAGWTAGRYQEVDGLVGDVAGYLRHAAANPGQAETWWKRVDRVDPAAIALVKARLPRLDAAGERALRTLRDERDVAVLGRVATLADLQGSWRRDREASRAHLASALHLTDAQIRDQLKEIGEATLTFNGDQMEGSETRAGAATAWMAGFRLEGRDLVFKREGREERLQVGVKGPAELIVGTQGVPSGVYRKR